jgi:hypothetical protein
VTSRRNILIFWVVLYVAATAGIGYWLTDVRAEWVRVAARPEARADWETWKEDVRTGEAPRFGPVKRRVPTASEPPATILLRDHFPSILLTVFLVWSALFGFLAMVVTGVLRGTPAPRADNDPPAPPAA